MRKLTAQQLEEIATREYPAYRHIIMLAIPRLMAACERHSVAIVFEDDLIYDEMEQADLNAAIREREETPDDN